jgi:hypothetical protein
MQAPPGGRTREIAHIVIMSLLLTQTFNLRRR